MKNIIVFFIICFFSTPTYTSTSPEIDTGHCSVPQRYNMSEFVPPPSVSYTNLDVSTITYLGGSGDDEVIGVEILSDKTIVVAGEFSSVPSATNTYDPLNISSPTHYILLFSPDGKTLNTIVEMDNIYDLDVDSSTDEIVIHRESHVTKLSSDGQTERWSSSSGTIGQADANAQYSRGKRLDVADNGNIAVLGNDNVTGTRYDGLFNLLDKDGTLINNFTIYGRTGTGRSEGVGGGTYNETWEDIAYDSSNGLVFVTGKAQRSSNYQTSFIMAYNTSDGTQEWKSYTLWNSAAQSSGLTADARGKRIEFENGSVYFIGNADGGNNLYTKEEQDHSTDANHNVTIDEWNNGAGFGSGKVTYFAKMDPTTGLALYGQFQFSSTGTNQAESFEALAIEEDDDGNVLIGGSTEHDLPERSSLTINGTSIGPKVSWETALLSVTSTLGDRNTVASFTASSNTGSGTIEDIEARNGLYVAVGTTNGDLVTTDALDDTRDGQEVFMVVYGNTSAILPVTLTNFDAELKGDAAHLQWHTASETNNSGFNIERSLDGRNWSKIGFVAGRGTTTDEQAYTFVDANLIKGTIYYRLKQVDFDDTFTYSELATVEYRPTGISDKESLIYPNPFYNQLTIESTQTQLEDIRVINALGQDVTYLVKGDQLSDVQIILETSALPPGWYLIQTHVSSFNVLKP